MLEYKDDKWKALLALAPTLLLMVVFTFYPIFNTIISAFMEGYSYGVWHDTDAAIGWLDHFGETVMQSSYNANEELIGFTSQYIGIGFGNFKNVFQDPTFLTALKNTSIMVFISVPLTVLIGLFISVALNGIKKAQVVFQTIYFLPYVTNTIALGLVFSVLFGSKNGLINSILVAIGGESARIAWITPFGGDNPTYISCLFVLMVYTIWNGLAFKILVFLSGMQSIDKQYYQAAQIDSTPRWRVFAKITVPLLSPMIAYITITSFIGAFKAYSSVIALFNGRYGPRSQPNMLITMVGYTYDKLSKLSNINQMGRACASALVLFAIIMAITAVEFWVSKKKVHY